MIYYIFPIFLELVVIIIYVSILNQNIMIIIVFFSSNWKEQDAWFLIGTVKTALVQIQINYHYKEASISYPSGRI